MHVENGRRWVRRSVALFGISVLLALAFLLVIPAPTWIVSATVSSRLLTENQWAAAVAAQRQSMLLVLGGGIAIGGLYVSFRRQRLGEATNRAERFATALTHLGSDRVEIRTAGIYSLESILIESPKDRAQISEVLCAFIRDHGSDRRYDPETEVIKPVAIDINAAAVVLARRPPQFTYPPVDISGADLSGVDLSGVDFRGANLERTYLVQAVMTYAKLNRARMMDSQCIGVNLHGADLTGAKAVATDFRRGSLSAALFNDAELNSAVFVDADLSEAAFERANLEFSNMTLARMTGASFRDALLDGVNFNGATAVLVNFNGARFTRAHGTQANFDRSILTNTEELDLARFEGSSFQGSVVSPSIAAE